MSEQAIQLLVESASQMLRTARMLDLMGYHDHYNRAGMDDKAERILAWLKEHGDDESKAFVAEIERRSTEMNDAIHVRSQSD